MSVSKKIRFEVFKRDGFICGYCGRKPPEVILEIDHINPKSKGGKDNINNFLTACFDCNRGKKNVPLDKIPQSIKDNLVILKEKELQLKEYNKIVNSIEKRQRKEMEEVNEVYSSYFPKWKLSEKFINVSLKRFFDVLPKEEILRAMHTACSVIKNDSQAISYFCGICWNKIKQKNEPYYNEANELMNYWTKIWTNGYYNKNQIKQLQEWLKNFTVEQIEENMSISQDWQHLEYLLGE